MDAAVQKLFDRNPNWSDGKVLGRVARRFRSTPDKVSNAVVRVYAYKTWQGSKIEAAVRTSRIRLHGDIETVHYQPDGDSIIIKIRASDNLTTGMVVKGIKRDLITAVHRGFSASPQVKAVSVWIVAPVTGVDVVKVAVVDVSRQRYEALGKLFFEAPRADIVGSLDPWLLPAMR